MNEGINVLSTFDGAGTIWVVLDLLGIRVNKKYSSEVDKHANKLNNYINTDVIYLGDVTKIKARDLEKIDLIVGGSPCQNLSSSGDGTGLGGEKSKLFFEFARLKDEVLEINPNAKYLLENVKPRKKIWTDDITRILGNDYIEINSALVSAQNRVRYYWTNIDDIKQPQDMNISLSDILEPNLPSCGVGGRVVGRRLNELGKREDNNRDIPLSQYLEIRKDNKSNCMTTVYKDAVVPYFKTDKRLKIKFKQNKASCLTGGGNSGGNHSDMDILVIDPDICRRYSLREAARLQTFPEEVIDRILESGVSPSQLYKIFGNGWTVNVIKHILSNFKNK